MKLTTKGGRGWIDFGWGCLEEPVWSKGRDKVMTTRGLFHSWGAAAAAAAAAAAKSLQSYPTLCDPIDGSPPGSLSLGFSRQEHWSGLPFPSPMHESEKWKWSRSVMSDSSWPRGLQPTRILCPWDFPGKSTGVGCHCLLLPGMPWPDRISCWDDLIADYGGWDAGNKDLSVTWFSYRHLPAIVKEGTVPKRVYYETKPRVLEFFSSVKVLNFLWIKFMSRTLCDFFQIWFVLFC